MGKEGFIYGSIFAMFYTRIMSSEPNNDIWDEMHHSLKELLAHSGFTYSDEKFDEYNSYAKELESFCENLTDGC